MFASVVDFSLPSKITLEDRTLVENLLQPTLKGRIDGAFVDALGRYRR